jgi:predicted  nucleic acid-binding Zn-ribbon protein
MLAAIEKLLILQERDRQIAQLQAELAVIPPQRAGIEGRSQTAQADQESARLKIMHIEAERKKLELEVETRKERIAKYSLQQFQTKRNEEYRALNHEIDTCKAEISKLEDQQLELMEQAEAGHKLLAAAKQQSQTIGAEAERQLGLLAAREANLQQQLAEISQGRARLAENVEAGPLGRYERIRRTKGERVVVGIEHGACGGCHVGLTAQDVLGCRASQEITQCPNCGRILYYTHDMDMVRSD